MVRVSRKDRIRDRRQVIADKDFLKQADRNVVEAVAKVIGPSHPRRRDLRQELLRADQRTSHQVGEEAYEQSKVDEALLGRILVPINVEHVAHRLKRVERDSHWQQELQHRQVNRQTGKAKQTGKLLREEAVVLEQSEQRKLNDDRSDQHALPS